MFVELLKKKKKEGGTGMTDILLIIHINSMTWFPFIISQCKVGVGFLCHLPIDVEIPDNVF